MTQLKYYLTLSTEDTYTKLITPIHNKYSKRWDQTEYGHI
jgi:hypothetical protein